MLSLFLFLFGAASARHSPATSIKSAVGTNGIVYAPINVWPYPKTVTFGGAAVGPHSLTLAKSSDITVTGCQRDLSAVIKESTEVQITFRSPARSYDVQPYALVNAACTENDRCSTDADCTDGTCFTQSSRRWNSTQACPPSAQYSTPCGCCVKPGLPAITKLAITCTADNPNTSEQTAKKPENAKYALNVTSDGISIEAATSQGASYALVTLAQLLRRDSEAAGGAAVLDRVPVFIHDEPVFSWRGMMLDTR
jgi:hypothetical protein